MERIIPFLLVLVAFGLRAFRLDLQSLWSDEGLSIYRASQDLAAIPSLSVAGIHPPLYDWLLHFWMLLAGRGEFSARFLSLFFGVLTLAVLFQVGRSLLGRGGAALTMLVAAVAPFLVYYSQETRMYVPALFFSVLSVLASLRWLNYPQKVLRLSGDPSVRPANRGGSPGKSARFAWGYLQGKGSAWLLCYVAAAAAAVYTHYYAWLIVAFQNLFFLLWAWASGRQALARLVPWVVAQGALGLAYLPWAGVLLDKYQNYLTPSPGSGLSTILYQTLVSFGLGYSASLAGATPGQVDLFPDHWVALSLALALLAVAIWGIVSSGLTTGPDSSQDRFLGRAFLPLYLALPMIAIVVLSWGKRDFAPRYVIFAAPAYYLLMGQGLASLLRTRKALGALALLLVLGASALSLRNYYYDPTYWRDDVRGVAQFLNSRSRDGDAILLNAPYLGPTIGYYYRGKAPLVGLPARLPADWEEELAALQGLAGQRERLWLVLWQSYYTDPQGRVQEWLDTRAVPFLQREFRGGIAVLGYLTRLPMSEKPPAGQPVGLQMGRTVELAAYQLPPEPICAGGGMPFTLYWRALRPMTVDYTVFVHLLDGQGRSWSQGDSQPTGGGFPTSRWPVGPLVADERWIEIPAEAPPGQYYLEMGMYDLRTMKRLGEGDPEPFQYALGPFQVLPAGC